MSQVTSRAGWMGAGAVLALGASLMVGHVHSAWAAPDDKPKAAAKAVKLTKPWSELTSLSDDQRQKIHDIHAKALAQINEIEKQEKADIMAVLTDAQKAELKDVAAASKKAAAEKRAAGKNAGAATKPAN